MRLWQQLEPWFRKKLDEETVRLRDELGIIPGHGVRLTELEPSELDRAWAVIADRVGPPSQAARWWDAMGSPIPEVLSEGAFAAASRQYMPLCFEVEGITVANERLPTPTLNVEIWADTPPAGTSQIGLFWRINDAGWEPQTVAALAVLIGDIRSLTPTSSIEASLNQDAFLLAVDVYLASRGDEAGPPHHS